MSGWPECSETSNWVVFDTVWYTAIVALEAKL